MKRTFEPYKGPRVKCCFCIYERVISTTKKPVIDDATQVLLTEKGPREVCLSHAKAGSWNASVMHMEWEGQEGSGVSDGS